ncbi:MAG: HpaII family restriction endonuclease, partial [Saezia sp.]
DLRTCSAEKLGFSIKSQLGSPSTLLNASKMTNFIYKIEDLFLSGEEICTFNEENKAGKEKIEAILKKGGVLKFIKLDNSIFANNLVLFDSLLPAILGELLLAYYSTKKNSIDDLVGSVVKNNPLNYDLSSSHPFYEYKIKRFLTDIALGMMPSVVWAGNLDATGGYLVVRQDGEVVCYHIYHRNEFEDYLFSNTRLETPSSSRHDFGYVYKHNNELFIKLNLQIRFKK